MSDTPKTKFTKSEGANIAIAQIIQQFNSAYEYTEKLHFSNDEHTEELRSRIEELKSEVENANWNLDIAQDNLQREVEHSSKGFVVCICSVALNVALAMTTFYFFHQTTVG